MGFYMHCGSVDTAEEKEVLLREVGTSITINCRVASGYHGRKG